MNIFYKATSSTKIDVFLGSKLTGYKIMFYHMKTIILIK
jgi:hypothetical protein